ncbi:MAG: YaiO family outer membrane beta-barrel protein [Sphingobacteriaceae bacterium]|nr:YaiO family outer membrane beta-barrel protein [Sphingobacteriaceae bacterium]
MVADPAYLDAELLLTRTYLWDKNYALGLQKAILLKDKHPENKEIRLLIFDALLWAGKNDSALVVFENLPTPIKQDPQLRFTEARIYHALERYEESFKLTELLLAQHPEIISLRNLHEQNIYKTQKQHLVVDYQYSAFDNSIPDWHWLSLEYGRQLKRGPVLFRATQISRFNLASTQLEIEHYSRLNDKNYVYAGVGIAQGVLFPTFRLGFEWFTTLKPSWELSAGLRHQQFSDAPVTSFTTALSKYRKNYWFSIRPFVIPTAGNLYLTYNLQARRYFKNSRQWLGITTGLGNSPDMDFRLNNPAEQSSNQIYLLDAFLLRLEGQIPIKQSLLIRPFAEYKNEEFLPGFFRTRYSTGLAIQYLFR